jgi:hypothetical protein
MRRLSGETAAHAAIQNRLTRQASGQLTMQQWLLPGLVIKNAAGVYMSCTPARSGAHEDVHVSTMSIHLGACVGESAQHLCKVP